MTSILLSPAHAGSSLSNELAQFGARVLAWPELKIDSPETYFGLDEAIENLFGYDWLVLKNERAAASFVLRFQSNHEPNELDDLKSLAIGDSTSETLVSSHIHVDLTVDRFPFENIFAALGRYAGDVGGLSFLLPSAGLNSELFEQQLTEAGARVDNVTGYRTAADNQRLAQLLALLLGGGIDCVIFTNSSDLNEFSRLVDTDNLPRVLTGVAVICGDSETAQAAHEFGLSEPGIMPATLSELALAQLINTDR